MSRAEPCQILRKKRSFLNGAFRGAFRDAFAIPCFFPGLRGSFAGALVHFGDKPSQAFAAGFGFRGDIGYPPLLLCIVRVYGAAHVGWP